MHEPMHEEDDEEADGEAGEEGDEALDREELAEGESAEKELSEGEARNYALRSLARQGTTTARLSQRLKRRGASPEVIGRLIAEFTAAGYLSDDAYAAAIIARGIARGYGPYGIVGQLTTRGIAAAVAQQLVAAAYPDDKEQEVLQQLLIQPRYRVLPRQKLQATLQRRGFSFSAIREISKI